MFGFQQQVPIIRVAMRRKRVKYGCKILAATLCCIFWFLKYTTYEENHPAVLRAPVLGHFFKEVQFM